LESSFLANLESKAERIAGSHSLLFNKYINYVCFCILDAPTVFGIFLSPVANCSKSAALK
jgi:hypothetical protein